MNARDAILAALGPDALPDAAERRAAASALLAGVERPPAPPEPADRLFLANLSLPSVAATHDEIANLDALPAAVARYLVAQGQPPRLYLPPDPQWATLDWSGVERLSEVPVDGGAALAVAVAAVAETGTLVLDTSPAAPMLPNFLALYHLVLVKRGSVVRWLEEIPPGAATARRQRSWITGVSGTTDIEGQYVRGAHGPRFLHVIMCG